MFQVRFIETRNQDLGSCSRIRDVCFAAATYSVINKRHGSETLLQTILLSIHTSHTKVDFNEFVANVLCGIDNMGMIIFDLRGCQRPKTQYLGTHFGNLTQPQIHPSAPALLIKDSPKKLSVMTLSLHSASISRILEPSQAI